MDNIIPKRKKTKDGTNFEEIISFSWKVSEKK